MTCGHCINEITNNISDESLYIDSSENNFYPGCSFRPYSGNILRDPNSGAIIPISNEVGVVL